MSLNYYCPPVFLSFLAFVELDKCELTISELTHRQSRPRSRIVVWRFSVALSGFKFLRALVEAIVGKVLYFYPPQNQLVRLEWTKLTYYPTGGKIIRFEL